MSGNEDDLKAKLQERSTEDLVSIVRKHDDQEWRPEVFDIARSILISRGLFLNEIEATGRLLERQASGDPVEAWQPTTDPPNYNRVADGVWFEAAEEIGDVLQGAGIPYRFVEQYERGLDCYVPSERGTQARALLVAGGLIPAQPEGMSSDVFCAVCGTELPAAGAECPACAGWSE